jgi:Sodium/calcium exchanger protein
LANSQTIAVESRAQVKCKYGALFIGRVIGQADRRRNLWRSTSMPAGGALGAGWRRAQTSCRSFRRTSTIVPQGFGGFFVLVRLSGLARREYWLFVVLLTFIAFLWYGNAFEARLSQPAHLVGIFAWLFVVILGSALSVVRHAERLAMRLGEPYGTLILTLSVTIIEIASITAIMLHGEYNPTLTRDTLFAVVMIIFNGRASRLLTS